MNIFVTYNDYNKCAQVLDDKRLIKMCLETCQMLCTSINEVSKEKNLALYKSTHINHPCSIWARETSENYRWLYNHFESLCNEYTIRFEKTHKCSNLSELLMWGIPLINSKCIKKGLTNFPNCTIYKDIKDVHEAYKKYLIFKWDNSIVKPKWTNREVPIFYER